MPETARSYLQKPMRVSGIAVLLVLVSAYESLAAPAGSGAAWAIALLAVVILGVRRAPRWTSYVVLAAALLFTTADRVFVDANGPQDSASDRDETAEVAATAFLNGRNPWAEQTPIGDPITAGPPSALALAPFVALFGRIDEATLLFWIAFLAVLLCGDLLRHNDTFLPLALCYQLGLFGIQHTQHWSLETLYYPQLLLVAAWWFQRSRRDALVGAALAIATLWRPNYAYPAFAFLCWCWQREPPRRAVRAIVQGAAVALLLVIAPFLRLGWHSLKVNNPLILWSQYAGSSSSDLVSTFLTLMHWQVGAPAGATLKATVALLFLWTASRLLRPLAPDHPFWHIALGGWAAHVLVWAPATEFADYTLMFVIPALFAIAFSPSAGWLLGRREGPKTLGATP